MTSEVTGGSVDNLKLVGNKKADMGFTMVDAACDALNGRDRFEVQPLPVRTLAALYPIGMHAVTVEGTVIAKFGGFAGKRVSVAESVNALKDGTIEALFWAGGLPTDAVTDLEATPGMSIRLLDHAQAVAKVNAKYGALYTVGRISKDVYTGMASDANNANAWNIMIANARTPDDLVRDILTAMFDTRKALDLVHKEASQIKLKNQARGFSPTPCHPSAVAFYKERGIEVDRGR